MQEAQAASREVLGERQGRPCQGARVGLPCRVVREGQGEGQEVQEALPCRAVLEERPYRVASEEQEVDREAQEAQAASRGGRVGCYRRSCFFLLNSPKAATFP
ncbi:MAG: hypothetical protein CMA56_03750 [Euryarchaeota archaeon]|nr:hypothetical protein [Euryarchaeota archaeon]